MDYIITILEKASPIGALVLSLVIILIQLRQGKGQSTDIEEIKENHLHEICEKLDRIVDGVGKNSDALIRIETKMNGHKRI